MMASTVDSDGDGVLDDVDRCPGTPKGATVDARGCPMDSDGDGVYDGIDQCPDTPPGVEVDARGCTVVTSEKEAQLLDTGTLRLENVYFDTNKATLKSESYAALDEAGGILVKWPQLRIEVAGHTDSVGEDAYNQDLSQRRAQSVLDYLLGNFSLKAAQFSVKGYGEDDPVADNGTSDGRGQNRRVELRVLNRDVLRKN
jgi:OOP family OmpA-OmpF porin